MAGFSRKQILLRREDGTPAGFLRLETEGSACRAELKAAAPDVRVLLLANGGAAPVKLGQFARGAGSASVRAEDVRGDVQVAVLAGDKLLLIGGDGVDFYAIRRRLAAPPRTDAPPKREAWRPPAPLQAVEETPAPQHEEAIAALPHPLARDGWVISTQKDQGFSERVSGRLMREGVQVMALVGVQGSYEAEPPPGLPGFRWEAGYWIREWGNGRP